VEAGDILFGVECLDLGDVVGNHGQPGPNDAPRFFVSDLFGGPVTTPWDMV